MRSYDVTLADLPEQRTAVVRGHVAHDGIGPFVGSALGRLMESFARTGDQPSGAPFARYDLRADGSWDIEVGCPVPELVAAPDGIELSTLPSCRAARVLHHGSYAELAGAYQAAERWIQDNAMRQDGRPWEVYLDDPSVPEHRTEVFLPCTEAHR